MAIPKIAVFLCEAMRRCDLKLAPLTEGLFYL
jgi:hypothetical protein